MAEKSADGEEKERLLFGGMARFRGIDFFGPNYASISERREAEILIRIDRTSLGRPENPLMRRVSRWPIVRSFFLWGRVLLQVVGSVKGLVFLAGLLAVLWLGITLVEGLGVGGPTDGPLGFLAAFPILPLLFLFFAVMKFTSIGRYHGAEHKAVAAYEKYGEVTLEEAQRCGRIHSRCGTNILIYIFAAAILEPFISWTPYIFLQFILISEAWYTFGETRPSIAVGNFLQKYFTTSEPARSELEVAVESLSRLLEAEESGRAGTEKFEVPARY